MPHKRKLMSDYPLDLDKLMHEEEKAREMTRLVPEMGHDEGLEAHERGYFNDDEMTGEREKAYQRVQSFRKNWYR